MDNPDVPSASPRSSHNVKETEMKISQAITIPGLAGFGSRNLGSRGNQAPLRHVLRLLRVQQIRAGRRRIVRGHRRPSQIRSGFRRGVGHAGQVAPAAEGCVQVEHGPGGHQAGNAFWEYKVEGVTVEQGVVQLRYAVTSKATPDTTFACPLIVSVPKGEYKAVVFIEDGKKVKTVKVAANERSTASKETP